MNGLCKSVQHYGPLAARILIAQLFLVSGMGKATAFAKTAAYMANNHLPMPEVLLVLTTALELGGGILLILGWKARYVAAALCAFTLLATMVFHPFWAVAPQEFGNTLNDFMKNLAIMGAMLYIMAYGAGPLSLGQDSCAADQSNAQAGKKRQPSKLSIM